MVAECMRLAGTPLSITVPRQCSLARRRLVGLVQLVTDLRPNGRLKHLELLDQRS